MAASKSLSRKVALVFRPLGLDVPFVENAKDYTIHNLILYPNPVIA
jgi:hypothetical protein